MKATVARTALLAVAPGASASLGDCNAENEPASCLPLESETVCDDDGSCTNTAQAVCNKIN